MEDEEGMQYRPMPYSAPMMHTLGGSVLYLTNPDKEIRKMELTFRSMLEDDNGGLIKIGGEEGWQPLMNEYGISSIIGIVQSIVNQVTIMSHLEQEEIEKLVDLLADTLVATLMVNRVRFGINSFSARNEIFFTAISTGYVCMKRAAQGGERRFLKGSVQEIKQHIESGGGRNRGGLMSQFNPWK
jgi:hypothetical protein